jgi:hypothetical protein
MLEVDGHFDALPLLSSSLPRPILAWPFDRVRRDACAINDWAIGVPDIAAA